MFKKISLMCFMIVLCIVTFTTAQAKEEINPKSCEFSGTIKSISPEHKLLSIQTTTDLMEFLYQGNKECTDMRDLKVGDNVKITCKGMKNPNEKQHRFIALCIEKNPPNPLEQSGGSRGIGGSGLGGSGI